MTAPTRTGKGAPLTAADYDRAVRMGAGWPSVAAMLSSREEGFQPGDILRAGPHRYEVVSGAAGDHHLATAGGVRLHVRPDGAGTVDLRAFGAVAGSNAAAHIRTALEAMRDGHFDRLRIPPGTWFLEADIEVANMRHGCSVDATGARFAIPAGSTYVRTRISGHGQILATTLTADAVQGVETVELAAATGVQEGDIIEMWTDEPVDVAARHPAPNGFVVKEVQVVRQVNGLRVWLDAPMIWAMDAAAAVAKGGSAERRVAVHRPLRNFKWTGGRWEFPGSPDGRNCLEIVHAYRPVVEDVEVIDPSYTSQGLRFDLTAYAQVSRVYIERAGAVNEPDGAYQSAHFGYGIIFLRSCYASVVQCDGTRSHHSFEAAHGTRDVTFTACKGYSETFAFNCHPGVGSVTLNDCTAEGKLCAQVAAIYTQINGGHFRGERPLNAAIGERMRLYKVSGATLEASRPVPGSKIVHFQQSMTADLLDQRAAVIFENVTCIGAGPTEASTVDIGTIRNGVTIVTGLKLLNGARADIRARSSIHIDGIVVDSFQPAQAPIFIRGTGVADTRATARGISFSGTPGASPYLFDLRDVSLHAADVFAQVGGVLSLFRRTGGTAARAYLRSSTVAATRLTNGVAVEEFRNCTVYPAAGQSTFLSPEGTGTITGHAGLNAGNVYDAP